jgi:hypothetical protein
MLFAHLKRILKLDRLRLRGISGARDEFLMAAAAQNLGRMAQRESSPGNYSQCSSAIHRPLSIWKLSASFSY